ncbi:hypothetical protein [Asticcacaulis sp.]|uniref:hypothetical protein n=1 Tax=Asticcacaulis sp. TaxID=1872648 RepID=UPI00261A7E36|nr:hypothetical protein [Asticcacaulis sp.]
MSITFPLVNPIPITENAGSVIVCLVPGSTPAYDASTKTMSLVMTMSEPTLFALASNSALTAINYKDGVCTVSGPPMYVVPTMLQGIKFTYDEHKDISKAKIMVVGHDGNASFSQTLTFANHTPNITASIAAARQTTFTIGVPSPFPNISITKNGADNATVTIIPEVPSALASIGTTETFGASVHANTVSTAGRAMAQNIYSAKGPVHITGTNVLSIAFKGTVAQVNMALAGANFIAPQAIGSNTVLNFNILVADDTSTILAQRITLNGIPPATQTPLSSKKEDEKGEDGYPIFGSMKKSLLPPAPVDGVPYTIQVLNGTPTWVLTKPTTTTTVTSIVPVNVASSTVFTSLFSKKGSDDITQTPALTAPPPAPSAVSEPSVVDRVLTALIIIFCLAVFGVLGWTVWKDWSDTAA